MAGSGENRLTSFVEVDAEDVAEVSDGLGRQQLRLVRDAHRSQLLAVRPQPP